MKSVHPFKKARLAPSGTGEVLAERTGGIKAPGTNTDDVWPFILPFLSPRDLLSVAKSSTHLGGLVKETLASGRNIAIDDAFLLKHSLYTYQDLYQHLGRMTTTLSLSNIHQSDVERLFNHFPCLKKLTLNGISIFPTNNGSSHESYPAQLSSLKLSNCQIEYRFLHSWFLRMAPTLQQVHLDKLSFLIGNARPLAFLHALNGLRNLTIEEMTLESFTVAQVVGKRLQSLRLRRVVVPKIGLEACERLRRLEIEAIKCSSITISSLPRLQHLSVQCQFDVPAPNDLVKWLSCEESLKTLIYMAPTEINQLTRFRCLEHLRLQCSWQEAAKIRSMCSSWPNMKTLDLIYSPPSEGYDLESALNDDCLINILSYLSMDDILSLGEVHPRLLSLRNPSTPLAINGGFLLSYPLDKEECTEFYNFMAQSTKNIHLMSVPETAVIEILDRLPSIRHLKLWRMKFKSLRCIAKIPPLESLSIVDVTGKTFATRLCQRVDETLTRLHVFAEKLDLDCLMSLHNVVDVSLDIPFPHQADEISSFLNQNTKIKRMSLCLNKHLPFKVPFPATLAHVRLEVDLVDQALPVLRSLNGDSLKSLEILNGGRIMQNGSPILQFLSRFPNLERFDLDHYIHWTQTDMRMMACTASLSTLRISGPIDGDAVFELVKRFSSLTDLKLPNSSFINLDLVQKLRRFLSPIGRVLHINRGSIFGWTI